MSDDRRRDLPIALGAAVLVAVGVLVGVLLSSGGEPTAGQGLESTTSSVEATTTLPAPSTSSLQSSTSSTTAAESVPPPVADTQGPAIGTIGSSGTALWDVGTYPPCAAGPHTVEISAAVDDPAGVDLVELSWVVGANLERRPMTRGGDGIYRAVIGPYADYLAGGLNLTLEPEVYARDRLGNESRATSATQLFFNDCLDDQAPAISSLQTAEPALWENANYGGCPTNPQSATVTAVATDLAAVDRVEFGWSLPAGLWVTGQMTPTAAADTYEFTIGPFDETTLSLGGGTAPIHVVVTAYDARGNMASSEDPQLILLHDCAI